MTIFILNCSIYWCIAYRCRPFIFLADAVFSWERWKRKFQWLWLETIMWLLFWLFQRICYKRWEMVLFKPILALSQIQVCTWIYLQDTVRMIKYITFPWNTLIFFWIEMQRLWRFHWYAFIKNGNVCFYNWKVKQIQTSWGWPGPSSVPA